MTEEERIKLTRSNYSAQMAMLGYNQDGTAKDMVEVIRCKDCRWWDKKTNSPYGYCNAIRHGYHSSHWEIEIYRTYQGDFFCADGERREDGENE